MVSEQKATVTDEMVEAACKGYWPLHWPRHFHEPDASSIRGHMRAALEAALSQPAEAVAVGYVACIACEGSPKAPNDPCGLCGTSSSPAPDAGEPAVKALEWLSSDPATEWIADSIVGTYRVWCDPTIDLPACWHVEHPGRPYQGTEHPNLETAKAAAQADCERRIRSALVPATAKGES